MNIKVISAGAGTGKTFNLARELLDDIASGAARPDAVVAITYTNKAAGELASRLRQRSRVADDGLDLFGRQLLPMTLLVLCAHNSVL